MKILPISTIVDESINLDKEFYQVDNRFVLLNWALYVTGVINRSGLMARYKIIRENKHYKKKNIYHDKILERWRENTYLANIWLGQGTLDKCYNYVLTLEDIFNAFKLYHYPMKTDSEIQQYIDICIKDDIITYFDGNWYDPKYIYEGRKRYAEQLDLPLIVSYDYDDWGYCCEDCSGPIGQYYEYQVSNQIQRHVKEYWTKELKKRFNYAGINNGRKSTAKRNKTKYNSKKNNV